MLARYKPWMMRAMFAFAVLTLILPFQNCSPKSDFRDEKNTGVNASLGGGEGYGGKIYGLLSESDLCSDPNLDPSMIRLQSNITELIAKNCQSLVRPEPVAVVLHPRLTEILFYNGQTFRDEQSNTPFNPSPGAQLALPRIEAENFTRLPTSGGGVRNGWLRITDNDDAEHDFTVTNAGTYEFRIRARGSMAVGVGAKMQLFVDKVSYGVIETNEFAAVYSFPVVLTAGAHEMEVAFINDYNDAGGEDRNLNFDWVDILR